MNNLNSLVIEGNLVEDPELKYPLLHAGEKGIAICIFTIAVNRYFKVEDEYQQEVSFFNVTTQGELAKKCGKKLKKGRGVKIIGRLKQDRWKKYEEEMSRVYIIVDHVEFKADFKQGDS